MRDSVISAVVEPDITRAEGAIDLAFSAVEKLVARATVGAVLVKDAYLDRLVEVAMSPDPKAIAALLTEMRRTILQPHHIAEAYIPAAARKLGKAWEDDAVSFANVSLGSSRLAAMLRLVEQGSAKAIIGQPRLPEILVVVPPGEQHTLGASVLVSQMRRKGHSVSLQLAPSLTALSCEMEKNHFDGVMISLGSYCHADAAATLVKTLRSLTKGAVPIVVGGALAQQVPNWMSSCDADLLTNDPDKALSFVSLNVPAKGSVKPVHSKSRGQF